MKKILVVCFLLLSSIVTTVEIPKGVRVIHYVTSNPTNLRNELQQICGKYTVLDWKISMWLGHGESNHNSKTVKEYFFSNDNKAIIARCFM